MTSTELETNPYRENPDKEGLKVELEEDMRWKRCEVKATTLLPNIIPFHREDKSDIDEILFHDGQKINEGSKSNIFFVFDDLIVTPPKEQNILLGVTRNYFLKRLLEEGFRVLEKEVKIEDLNKADEIWVTSSTKEINNLYKVMEDNSTKNIWGPRHYLETLTKRVNQLTKTKMQQSLLEIAEIDASIKGLSPKNPWQAIRDLAITF